MDPTEPIIHLAVVSDTAFLQPIEVMLHSILRWHDAADLVVHWVHVRMDRTAQQSMESLGRSLALRLELVAADSFASKVGWPSDFNPTLLKLLLPAVLSHVNGRLLYLDGDIVVEAPLWPLWRSPLQAAAVGGIRDSWVGSPGFWPTVHCPDDSYRDLWKRHAYINAGVVLFDAPRYRALAIAEHSLRWLATHPQAMFLEQDALNAVARDTTVLLPAAWNVHGIAGCYIGRGDDAAYTARELRDAYRNPKIIHFAGPHKPWDEARHWQPHFHRYFRARRGTRWHRPLSPSERLRLVLLDLVGRLQYHGYLRTGRRILYALGSEHG